MRVAVTGGAGYIGCALVEELRAAGHEVVVLDSLLHGRRGPAEATLLVGDVRYVHRDEDPRDYRVSFERIATELGFVGRMRVPDGIAEVLEGLEARSFGDPYSPAHSNLAPA